MMKISSVLLCGLLLFLWNLSNLNWSNTKDQMYISNVDNRWLKYNTSNLHRLPVADIMDNTKLTIGYSHQSEHGSTQLRQNDSFVSNDSRSDIDVSPVDSTKEDETKNVTGYNAQFSEDVTKERNQSDSYQSGDSRVAAAQVKSTKIKETQNFTGDNYNVEDVANPNSQNDSLESDISRLAISQDNAIKTILFWNSFHHQLDYGIGLGSEALASRGCPVDRCSFTVDKTQLQTVDAIIIDGFQSDLPQWRGENQIYVFHFFESPIRQMALLSDLPKWQDVFNLTFTYMYDEDTDISAGHGRAVRRPIPRAKALPQLDEIKRKTKMVLWIVSNCHPNSGRMEYAMQLKKHVQVDIIGYCGNMSCPLPRSSTTCIRQIAKDYMFYLSFENSYCKDYYSEKVIAPLARGMVPITMGAANYSRFLPPHSFIDSSDFSPRQLAQKLLYLKEHTDEYMKYFQWRQDYAVTGSLRPQGFCRLCEILHTTDYPYRSNFSMAQYWNAKTLCLTKEEHLKKLGIN